METKAALYEIKESSGKRSYFAALEHQRLRDRKAKIPR